VGADRAGLLTDGDRQIRASRWLRQLDHVAVGISVSGRSTPRLCDWWVKHFRSRGHRGCVSLFDIADTERDLSTGRCGPVLGFVQSEVDEGAVSPRSRGMSTTSPWIIAVVIVDMEVETEPIPVDAHRAIEISHCQYDGHKPIGVRH
jgi:hypothetical protein